MYKTKFKNSLSLIIVLLAALSFESCKTTRSLAKESIEPNAPMDAPFIVAHDVVFPDIEGNCKYIFFRLFNPAYKNPLYIANVLKGGISITKTEDVPDLSHASINFSLDDNYYGLTLGGEYQLVEEECALPQNNKYMKNCDPEKSEQITYALKVTEEEYNKTKEFVERYAQSTDIKYASSLNFKIALFSIKKKFFTPKEHQQFGTIIYPDGATNKKVDLDKDEEIQNDFVCSTFVGYVLYNHVESVSNFFDENNIKYEYLNVSDIALIPGIVPLFYSNWDTYNEAAEAFVEEYPEFSDYLTK